MFAGLLVTGLLGMQILDLKTLNNQTPFLLISSLLFFQRRQIKTSWIFIINSTRWKLSHASLAGTIKMKTNCGIPQTAILPRYHAKEIP